MSKGEKIAAAAGITALAAAVAGAVFLYGTEAGKKKRKEIKSWALRVQADVIDKMQNMKEWSEDAYNNVIDNVAEKYKSVKGIETAELAAIIADLRRHWKNIKKQVEDKPKRRTTKKAK